MARVELPDLRVHLLGGPRATIGDQDEVPLSRRAKLLLVYELLHRNPSRTAVADAISLTAAARRSPLEHLYKATNDLRNALGDEWVPRWSSQMILAARPWVDIDELATMDDEQAVIYCKAHDELLPGFPELRWVAEARANHHTRLMQRLCRLTATYQRTGRSSDAGETLGIAWALLPDHQFEMVVAASDNEPSSSAINVVPRWPRNVERIMNELSRVDALLDSAEETDQPSPTYSSDVVDTLEFTLSELERVTWSGRFYPIELVDAVATLITRAEGYEVEGATGCRLKLALVRCAYGGYRTGLAEIAPLLAATPSPEVAYRAGAINMNLGRLDVAKRLFDSALTGATDPEMRLRARNMRDLWLPYYRGEHQAVIDSGRQLVLDPGFRALPAPVRADIVWRIGVAHADLGDKSRAHSTLQLAHSLDADSPNPHRPRVLAQAARDTGDHSSYEHEWNRFHDILRASSGRGLWPHYNLAEARRRTDTDSPNPKRALSYALVDANLALKDWQQTGYLHGYCKALIQRGRANHKLGHLEAAATDYMTAHRLTHQTQLEVRQQAYKQMVEALYELSQRDQQRVQDKAQQQIVQVWSSFLDSPPPVFS
jgi:tetratricopeptide (TPR) repeat protein